MLRLQKDFRYLLNHIWSFTVFLTNSINGLLLSLLSITNSNLEDAYEYFAPRKQNGVQN